MAEEKKSTGVGSYSLMAGDNPGTVITPVLLKGDNYEEWVMAIKMALRAKKKLGFIDETIKRPVDDSTDMEDWWTINSMVVSWIFNTIEPSLRSTITYVDSAREMWENLQQRFFVGNGPCVQHLKSEIAICKQHGDSVMNYFPKALGSRQFHYLLESWAFAIFMRQLQGEYWKY